MKTTVIHHSADFDGLFCRAIAKKFLPDAELVGWDYKDPNIPFPAEGMVYVLDLSPDCFESMPDINEVGRRLVWIDHHKTAIDKYPSVFTGCRIDGVAACRLAWQWFAQSGSTMLGMPPKESFINRLVMEPLAVRLAGEYDIWDKRDPHAELFQHGLRSQELTDHIWNNLLDDSIEETIQVQHSQIMVMHLLENGRVVEYVRENEYSEVIKQQGFDVEWEGLKFLACNSHELDIRSHLFEAGIRSDHDALVGFTFNGTDWRVSMYGVPGKPDVDLSKIAVKYGGGGHKQACGFRCVKLPFLP